MLIEVPYNAKTYEFVNSVVWVGDDGIVYSNPKVDRYIQPTREMMEGEMQLFMTLSRGRKMCMIAVAHPKAESPRPEDREYISQQLEKVMNAFALITTNPLNRMVANLFFLFKPPPYPMKMFSNVDDARKWLKSEKMQCKPVELQP